MSNLSGLGIGGRLPLHREEPGTEHVLIQRLLQRVLAFRGHSIDDVVNNPIVKNDVLGYWKVLKQIQRRSEALELEQQWNSLGRRL